MYYKSDKFFTKPLKFKFKIKPFIFNILYIYTNIKYKKELKNRAKPFQYEN